jgi:hypothetical protein
MMFIRTCCTIGGVRREQEFWGAGLRLGRPLARRILLRWRSRRMGGSCLIRRQIRYRAVKRIDALFAIEREINGRTPQQRLRVRLRGILLAAIYTLIQTAKLDDVDPQAWLADVLARLQDHPAKRINELLPWNWKRGQAAA